MKSCTSDVAQFFKRTRDKLSNLYGIYVDDTLRAGDSKYSQLIKHPEIKFRYNQREQNNI